MNFKPVEMQIAIPRTNDLVPLHNQLNQKPVTDQSQLAGQEAKHQEDSRHRSSKPEEASGSGVADRERRNPAPSASSGKKRTLKEDTEETLAEHPYKGRHIDFTY
ncbi:hypothetical protein [Paenibacillus gansuensis]|uniref:Uncharacterized protein n=1 Tax=Paenibacillus gansuensis TaxID=306542 RepID=A0ABW5PCG3_9BACL